VHYQYVNVAGHRIAYLRQGKGPVLLLIHGITTYSRIWKNIIPALMEKFDVIAVDLPGCGNSDKPLDISYALKAHANYLTTMMHKLGISRYHIIGHDLGGGIGQIMAVQQTNSILSLSLINSVAFNFWPVQPITAMRIPVIRQLLMSICDLGAFKLLLGRGMLHRENITVALIDDFWRPLANSEGKKAFLHFAKCLDNHDLMRISGQLKRLRISVLIVRGDADPFLSAKIVEKLHAHIPHSRLQRIATASHYIQEDEPAWLSKTLLKFLGEAA